MLNQEPSAHSPRGGHMRRFGMWSRSDHATGVLVTLPPLPSITRADATRSADPAHRMRAAILQAGGALLVLHSAAGAAWAVPQRDGPPLLFSHAIGNRLVVNRLIKRHPSDCRDIRVARYIVDSETPLSDEEIDSEIKRETTRYRTYEKRRVAHAKAKEAGPLVVTPAMLEQRERRAESMRRLRAQKKAQRRLEVQLLPPLEPETRSAPSRPDTRSADRIAFDELWQQLLPERQSQASA
jgi:hypothetical protein